ncbi:MAG: ABC transporter substrate-binding protein, partial [Anaerolineae bacterium]
MFSRRAFLKHVGLAAGGALLAGSGLSLLPSCSARKGLGTLSIQAPASPPSLALAKLVHDGAFAGLVDSAEFLLWKTADEMRARITSGQAQISGLPVNAAATLYNKGMGMQLANVYIWGILYLVSADERIKRWEDLRGQEVLIPFQGDLPDLITQLLLGYRGMALGTDISPRYVTAAPEAANLLAAGQAKHAVLSEPSATLALLKAKGTGITLHRAIDYQADWAAMTGQPPRLPMAGVAVLPSLAKEHRPVVDRLQSAHAEAVAWVRDHPKEAAALGTRYIPEMPAQAMEASLPHIT